LPFDLKAAVGPPEAFQGRLKRSRRNSQIKPYSNRCSGIQDVVSTRSVQVEFTQRLSSIPQLKLGLKTHIRRIHDVQVRLPAEAITYDAPFDARDERLQVRLVQAKNHCTIERHLVDESHESVLQVVQARVTLHVVFVDVGN